MSKNAGVILIRLFLIPFLLFIDLQARENPFFPAQGEKDITLSSNENRGKEPLKRAAVSLPPQARILQKVTLEFKNLDGSIETKSIELSNSIDWHLPIFITQSYEEPSTTPPQISSANASAKFKQIASIKYITLSTMGKSLKLATSDEALRDFLLLNPHRIVIDFKKETDIKSYIKTIPQNVFKEVRIGNHKGYYRVVVELDGYYRYTLKKIPGGYLVELE